MFEDNETDVDVNFYDEDDDCENWLYADFQDEKPSWESAPEWAQTLGVCTFGTDKGNWCWCRGERPSYFKFVEARLY